MIALPQLPGPAKPLYATPCNGCGLCCAEEVCLIGMTFGGFSKPPCPALEFDGGRFWCGMIRNPVAYVHRHKEVLSSGPSMLGRAFAEMLHADEGCDSEIAGLDFEVPDGAVLENPLSGRAATADTEGRGR